MKSYYFLLLTVFILGSCTREIEIAYPEFENKLVVNCLFSPDSVFKVHLAETAPANQVENEKIVDAKCEIWADKLLLETLTHTENGVFVSTRLPETGKNYELKIYHEQFGTVTASSYIPQRAVIHNITKEDFVYPIRNINLENRYYSVLKLEFSDISGKTNYYYVDFSVRNFTIHDSVYEYYDWEILFGLNSYSDAIIKEQIIQFEPSYFIFNNETFSEENTIVEALYEYPYSMEGTDNGYQLKYHFGMVSKEYYLYAQRLLKHDYNQETEILFYYGSPVDMYSNIENGYGIFAGYNFLADTITTSFDAIPN